MALRGSWPVFDSAEVDKIGPVRSARPYFIDKAREHGGLMLVHCGGSPEALSIISKEPYPTMNEMTNGDYFFRDRKERLRTTSSYLQNR